MGVRAQTSACNTYTGCSLELKEAIASLIYAAPRCGDLQELQKVRDIFISRYGADYVSAILELQPECAVNTQIIQNLSSRPPNSDVRLNLLKEIASEHKINWNYQRAVAASFNTGEASENSRTSLNAKLASKENRTDSMISSNPVDTKPKPALAAQPPTPAKASLNKLEPSESIKPKHPVDVSENFDNKPGHKGQASFAARHNLVPSMAHDISPRERGLMGANRASPKGSPKMIDTFMHQEIESKESASFASRSSSSSTMPKIEPRGADFGDVEHVSPAEIQQRYSSVMHQDDKLKIHPSSEASNASSSLRARHKDHFASSREILDLGAPSKVKPSLFPAEEHTSERASSALQSALGSRALPSRTKASPVQSSSANISVLPGELDGSMQQKASASKPEPHAISNLQADGIGESLAAKQYVGAHQNYAKVDSTRTHEDFRGKKLSQIKLRPKQGDIVPAANIMVDSHAESISINQFKDYNSGHQQTKRSSKALNRDNNSEENDAVGQMKGTYQQRVFDSAEIHDRSRRGKEGVEWTSSYAHARNQQEEKSSDHQKHSTIAGPNGMHSIPPVELRSMKVDVDQELAELETAIASAARAADTAIEMLRTCSIKSRADKKGVQRERNSQARMSYGNVSSETGFESSKGFCKTLNQQECFAREKLYPRSTAKGDLDHKEPCQEQEPVTLDSEMPHFDDSSDDSTSEELPPYSKSRPSLTNNHARAVLRKKSDLFSKLSATPFGAYGWNDGRQETLQVYAQRNLPFRDDDCAESVDSFSPKSAASSQHPSNPENLSDVQPSYKTHLEDYEEPDNVRAWSAGLQSRNNAYAAGEKVSRGWHGIKDDRVSNMKLSNENVGKGVLKWEGLSTGDVSKKKWTLGNAQSRSQPYKQHEGMATQNMADNFQGVSRRSVRSVGPT
ncbi:hypothetical protein L7F22_026592 [Adiantum nelumboides]|nr:hypothetical protein [Adiantum nelumboides]